MRDDDVQSLELQIVQRTVEKRWKGEIRELHEQIGFLVQREPRGIGAHGCKVFVAHMQVASGREDQARANLLLQLISEAADALGIEGVVVVGVGCGHDARDAVGDGRFGHAHGIVHGLRPVVQAGQQVTVNIDHRVSGYSVPQARTMVGTRRVKFRPQIEVSPAQWA